MIFLILLCVAVPILALAAQRDDFKRIGLIAIGLEIAKYILFFLVSPIRNELFNFVFTFVFYSAMLPEIMIGDDSGPSSIWQWIMRLCAGVIWNLLPAYLISLLLPDQDRNKTALGACPE
jgi:hypothetical protein